MVEYTRQQLESKDKEELIEIILAMQAMVKILVERVDNLEKEVSRLKKPTTSRNSSLPPSKDLTNQRYPKPRREGERKTGGQPGSYLKCRLPRYCSRLSARHQLPGL